VRWPRIRSTLDAPQVATTTPTAAIDAVGIFVRHSDEHIQSHPLVEATMKVVTFFTPDTRAELVQSVQAFADLLDAKLVVCTSFDDLQRIQSDLIVWYCHPFNMERYNQIQLICRRIVAVIDEKYRPTRFSISTINQPQIPCPSAWIPLYDPEGLVELVKR
jgi:hypothetical protein